MTLLRLPLELIEAILLELDVKDILSCQRTSQLFLRLFKNSAKLQYRVECAFAGVCDNPACTLPIQMRLQMLRDRELAWATLRPAFTHRIHVAPNTNVDCVDITSGHYYVGITEPSSDSLSWVQSCLIPVDEADATALKCTDGMWSKLVVEGSVDFATSIDEHDLFAFLTIHPTNEPDTHDLRISLFQHSTRRTYTMAENPIFPVCSTTSEPDNLISRMEICGDTLVVAIPYEELLFFFNWRSGKLTSSSPLSGFCDLSFLRNDVLCLAMPTTLSLVLYHVPSGNGGIARQIHSFSVPREFFPSVCTWIESRGSPNPTDDGSFPIHVSHSQPFLENPEEAIMVFDFHFRDSTSPISMVVHRRSLLRLLPQKESWLTCEPLVTPWVEWGPQNTRWFDSSGNGDAFTTIPNGQRYIHYLFKHAPTNYTIVDFNINRIRKASNSTAPRASQEQKKTDLQTRGTLPCVERRSETSVDHHMVFASDTGLIGLNGIDNGSNLFQNTSFDVVHFG